MVAKARNPRDSDSSSSASSSSLQSSSANSTELLRSRPSRELLGFGNNTRNDEKNEAADDDGDDLERNNWDLRAGNRSTCNPIGQDATKTTTERHNNNNGGGKRAEISPSELATNIATSGWPDADDKDHCGQTSGRCRTGSAGATCRPSLDIKMNRNEWNLMQIVESAESKLMRQQQQQQQQVASAGSGGRHSGNATRRPTSMLKCPAFATIALDEQLDEDCFLESNFGERRLSSSSQRESAKPDLGQATDCGRKSCSAESLATGNGGATATATATAFAIATPPGRTTMTNRHGHNGAKAAKCNGVADRQPERDYISSSVTLSLPSSASCSLSEGGRVEGAPCRSKQAEQHLDKAPPSADRKETLDRDDGEEDRAAGATPTNDLVRALIERDRRALWQPPSQGLAASRFGLPESSDASRPPEIKLASGGRRDDCRSHCCPAASVEVRLATTADERTGPELANSKSAGNNDGPSKQQQQDQLTELRRQSNALDLCEALIGKCQRQFNQFSGGCGGQSSPASAVSPKRAYEQLANAFARARCQATRKSTDLGQPESSKQSAPTAPAETQPRRHSTYLLPVLLNEQRACLAADSSDDSESDGSELELKLTDSSRDLNQADACNDGLDDERTGGRLVADSRRPASRMSASASSPSNLSTPTNERPELGCGGPCCRSSRAAGLNSGRLHLAAPKRPASFVNCPGKVKSSAAQVAAASKAQQAEAREDTWTACSEQRPIIIRAPPRQRNRTGSNPLDRLTGCAGSRPTRQLSSSKKAAAAAALSSARKQSVGAPMDPHCAQRVASQSANNKGHSIMNILAGAGQVGARSPRHFFLSGTNSKQQQQQQQLSGPLDRRASETTCDYLQSHSTLANSATEHYEPLIPESGFKIVVMGTSGSGKTSIIQRFMYNSFNWRHLPTVEDTYFIEFPYMKNTINISISDTSGTYQFPAMRRLAINSGDAFILVYSVDNPQSFDDLEQLRQTILDEREQAFLEASASINSTDSASSGLASCSNSAGCGSGSSQSSGLTTPATNMSQNHLPAAMEQLANCTISQARHWSLASLFNVGQHHHNGQHNSPADGHNHQKQHCYLAGQQSNNITPHSGTSRCSSICSSTCSLANDGSRRSSVSAAEAALKTRRTRHPPMVIVANKHDLPEEQHLVDSDEIEALAVIDWNNGFIRASAALNYNINEIFQQVLKQAKQPPTLAEAIISKRRKSLPPKLPNSLKAV